MSIAKFLRCGSRRIGEAVPVKEVRTGTQREHSLRNSSLITDRQVEQTLKLRQLLIKITDDV